MFTAAAFVVATLIAWHVSRAQKADRDDVQANIKHARQDLRLIAFLLFAILVALGIIADRIH